MVPEALLAPARRAIAEVLGVDPDDPVRRYPARRLSWSVVPVHHAQAFWDVRQHPRLYEVFRELHGRDDLWVSMDRAIYKVPSHPDFPDESRLHWDLDPRVPREPAYQGMIFLTDTPAEQGAFECVPAIFRDLPSYLRDHAPEDPVDGPTVRAPVSAGDLVLWDARLPHHGGANTGDRPRMSLAVVMNPAGTEEERHERIGWWRDRRAPPWWRGWPGQVDPEPGGPAALTALGRRLVGLDPW